MTLLLKLILIFLITINYSHSSEVFKVISSVNNQAITYIDLKKEIQVLKIFGEKTNLKEKALNNLINEKIKIAEIKKNNIEIEIKNINNYYYQFLKKLRIDENEIKKETKINLYNKVKLEIEWNSLIYKKYGNKININILEIKNKIKEQKKTDNEFDEKKLIEIEKNNKIKVFSNYHLNFLKSESSIRYFE